MTKKLLLAAYLISSFFVGFAQTENKPSLPKGCVQLKPDEMQWTDTASFLPKGVKYCILYGDPKKPAPFAIRLKLPPKLTMKTHYHLNDEVVTLLEGSVAVGFGDRTAASKTNTLTLNSFYVNAANVEHFLVVGDEGATIQVNSIGPWVTKFK
jgi:hypothetical protein